MGVGLSISRTIIEAHGGHLRARNRDEGGATFGFTLPTVDAGGRRLPTEPVVHVIDDDDAARHSLEFLIECAGYRVADYDSALAFLARSAATGSWSLAASSPTCACPT